ncbi:hypothetical protein DCAR_0205784 [Daucus carota subsp. sativus]|uniref:Integrase catalytic domain-containing protein n=1 Tax=Daucus carota subsp. sativus TaxID=79200 RepID=A0AAF0WBK1_DAUCS|nr:hypothetical protein DCAR_0205784 [Daucus carota subsp. sativus]
MATEDKEVRNENGYSNPLFLANSDNAKIPLGNVIFNGDNFLNWSRSIKLALGSKNKLGFLDGKVKKPQADDVKYPLWIKNDYMIRGWLFRSMNEKIANSFTYIDSVERLWNELEERYTETNAPLLYSLKKQAKNLEQENMTVSEYYFKLKRIWDEIQDVEGLPKCTCEAMKKCTCELLKKFIEIQERNEVIDFVIGLNKKNENIAGNIMAMEPLPTLNRAFHLVQQAEKQKQVAENQCVGEASAFAIGRMSQGRHFLNSQKRETKEMKMKKWCDHCKKKGHTVDEYGKLVSAVVQKMMKLFNTQQASGGNNNKMANFAGIILVSNVVSIVKPYDKNTWIIDSGASNHMCGNKNIFHNLRSLDLPVRVGLPDGSVKIVDKMGDIKLSRRLTLYDVLYIDEFNHNLLSVSKLIKTSKINVMFDTKICILQDPSTKEIVGRGKEENGLYRLEVAKDEENQVGAMRFWRQSVPQQNGRVERKHRHLIETARTLRINAGLPKYLWGECVKAATHLINLMPSAVIGWETPYERLLKKKPEYEHLRI